jgi:hypothetical protein
MMLPMLKLDSNYGFYELFLWRFWQIDSIYASDIYSGTNIWRIVFNMTSCLYYLPLHGKHSIHFADLGACLLKTNQVIITMETIYLLIPTVFHDGCIQICTVADYGHAKKQLFCSLNIISCSHNLLFCSHKKDVLFPKHTILFPQHIIVFPQCSNWFLSLNIFYCPKTWQ